jgi:hypothetical protein
MAIANAEFNWTWFCWLEQPDQASLFVYGCIANSTATAAWARDESISISDGLQLKIFQRVVARTTTSAFLAELEAGKLRLAALIGGSAPEHAIKDRRAVIEPVLGHSAARVESHYTLPDPAKITALGRLALGPILSILQERLGLPFTSTYATRFGNLEVFHLQAWLDQPQPFLIETPKSEADIADRIESKTFVINRTPEFAAQQHLAHVVGRNNGDLIFDRLVTLQSGEVQSAEIEGSEAVYETEFRLFSADGGTLLHYEHNHYIREIGMTMNAINREVVVDDELTKKARSTGNENLARRAGKVAGYSSHPFTAGFSSSGGWRQHSQRMRQLVDEAFPGTGEDRWFPRSTESEVAVIEHINSLISQVQARKAVLWTAPFA